MKSATDIFAQKKLEKDIFNSEILYGTGPNLPFNLGSIIMLVISNQPCTSGSSDFKITCTITPWIVLHLDQLLNCKLYLSRGFIVYLFIDWSIDSLVIPPCGGGAPI